MEVIVKSSTNELKALIENDLQSSFQVLQEYWRKCVCCGTELFYRKLNFRFVSFLFATYKTSPDTFYHSSYNNSHCYNEMMNTIFSFRTIEIIRLSVS